MPPSSPALRSSAAHQAVIRSSVAQHLIEGQLAAHQRGVARVLGHRCPPGRTWPRSRGASWPSSGATSITARAIAARSPPGVSRAARSSTSCLGGAGLGRIEQAVAWTMIRPCYRETSRRAAPRRCQAGRVCRCSARSTRSSARTGTPPARTRPGPAVNSASSAAGFRPGQLRDHGQLAARRRGPRPGPTRTAPRSARPRTPRRTAVRPRGGVGGDRQAARSRAARRGPSPVRTRPPGWTTRRGTTRAEPGWPGPRRPVLAASTASSSSAAAARISASSSAVNGSNPRTRPPRPRGSPRPARRAAQATPRAPAAVIGSRSSQARSSSRRGPRGPVTRA